jgi:ABC-type transporter Mla subunit MlaD
VERKFMPTRSQKFRLGLFLILGFLALATLLFIIGSERFFQKRDIYYIVYKDVSVSGLEIGSPVKFLGIRVGIIDEIKIDPQDVSRIIVTVALQPGTPIKQDARADINIIGITGLKMIEIHGGSKEADLVDPGQFIKAGSSITDELTGKAEIIAEKIELLLNNLNRFTQPENLDKVTQLIENSDRAFAQADQMLAENRKDIRNIIANSQKTMFRVDSISHLLLFSAQEVHRITTSDTLGKILSDVQHITGKIRASNLEQLIHRLSAAVEKTNLLLNSLDDDLERGSQDFFISIKRLKSSLDYLDETSRMINEDPSILLRGTTYDDIPDDDLDR